MPDPFSDPAAVGPTLAGRALQDTLRRAIATRRGCCSRDADHAGWVAALRSSEEEGIYDRTLEDALPSRLVSLMAPEPGVRPFLA